MVTRMNHGSDIAVRERLRGVTPGSRVVDTGRMPSAAATNHIHAFSRFVQDSPSSYHAARTVAEALQESGFVEYDERRPWDGPASGGGYVVRDGAVIAWLFPETVGPDTGFRIVGAHTDSPGFKLKPTPDMSRFGWQQVGVEVYGGPLLNSWLDRDIGFAGRLVTVGGEQALVSTGPLLRFPQLAPHLDRSVNENLHLDRQTHLLPVVGVGDAAPDIRAHLCALAGIDPAELGFYDVITYPTEAPGLLGLADELLASSRMDNLVSVHAGLTALCDVTPGPDVAVLALFDHEEVGSQTRSGASGPFLAGVLRRIATLMGAGDPDAFEATLARSVLVSADAGHAVHPNYPGMFDPTNLPVPNGGPLLKINAQQRYATDAVSGAIWMRVCEAADVPTQPFVSNNSVSCGSTIGPLSATRLGVTTVDVGVPLVSMHSARELCGVEDPWYLRRAVEAFWAGA